jgi:hypothetical protein
MFKWIKNLGLFLVIRDFQNYRDWIRIIKREVANPISKFNKFGLNYNFFYNLYVPISLDDGDKDLPDKIKRLRLVESLAPIHRYLDEDLGFSEYIVPEFNQFYDDQNKPTLTYGVVYKFAFKKFSIQWLIKWIVILSIFLFVFIRWPIIGTIIKWISNLI